MRDVLLDKREDRIRKFYVCCAWHKEGKDIWRNRISGNIAPPWVEDIMKGQTLSHSICDPCRNQLVLEMRAKGKVKI
jgi:hypothetical protein